MPSEQELYTRIKELGKSTTGKVFLVQSKADQKYYVIKQTDIKNMSESQIKEIITEAKILATMQHQNIINFVNYYKTKKQKLCITMEYAENGDLSQKIKGQSVPFPEDTIIKYMHQILLAVSHVHNQKVIHRDIKSQNIFLTKSDTIKLGDFGISRQFQNTQENIKTVVGTPYYLSPEIIENNNYTTKTDMWSLGVILYELMALQPPFQSSSLHGLALNIVKGQYEEIEGNYSEELKQLVKQLLEVDQEKRPSAQEVLKLSLFKQKVIYRKRLYSPQVNMKEKIKNQQIINKNIKQFQSDDEFKDFIKNNQVSPNNSVFKKRVLSPKARVFSPNTKLPALNQDQKIKVKPPINKNEGYEEHKEDIKGKKILDTKSIIKKSFLKSNSYLSSNSDENYFQNKLSQYNNSQNSSKLQVSQHSDQLKKSQEYYNLNNSKNNSKKTNSGDEKKQKKILYHNIFDKCETKESSDDVKTMTLVKQKCEQIQQRKTFDNNENKLIKDILLKQIGQDLYTEIQQQILGKDQQSIKSIIENKLNCNKDKMEFIEMMFITLETFSN